jgi:hypothetical protein
MMILLFLIIFLGQKITGFSIGSYGNILKFIYRNGLMKFVLLWHAASLAGY